jgi:hypothetical protein
MMLCARYYMILFNYNAINIYTLLKKYLLTIFINVKHITLVPLCNIRFLAR